MTNFNTGLIDVLTNMHVTVLCLLLTNNQQKDRLYIYWMPARQEATENWQQCGEDYILPSLRQNWDSHNLQWTKGNANCIQTDCWACRVEMFLSLQKKKKEAELLAVYKQALCLTPTWQKTKLMKSNMTKTMTCYQHATAIKDMTDYLQQNRCTQVLEHKLNIKLLRHT